MSTHYFGSELGHVDVDGNYVDFLDAVHLHVVELSLVAGEVPVLVHNDVLDGRRIGNELLHKHFRANVALTRIDTIHQMVQLSTHLLQQGQLLLVDLEPFGQFVPVLVRYDFVLWFCLIEIRHCR